MIYGEPTPHDYRMATARFEEMGKKFCIQGQHLKQVEWRTALELPTELVARQARAADVILVGQPARAATYATWSSRAPFCCGQAGLSWWCPTSLVHSSFVASWWRARIPVNVGARSATRFHFCGQPRSPGRRNRRGRFEIRGQKDLTDIGRYLVRHGVVVADEIWKRARGPVATELLELVRAEKAGLIVAGGYGHTRLGESIFGGVAQELLASSPVCCMLSH